MSRSWNTYVPPFACSITMAALLAACGGGGGGTSGVALPVAAPVTTTTTQAPVVPVVAPPQPPASPPPAPEPEPAPPAPTCVVDAPALITVDTTAGQEITSKDTYLPARLTVSATAASPALDVATGIRGRGNSTWNLPKKPYRLKLDTKAAVLGLPTEKDWTLLANYTDKTLLRNSVAFCLGSILGMKYVPRSKYAELTLNGKYEGLYQLTEQIETGPSRVPIGTEDTTTDSGYLLEWDLRRDGDPHFDSDRGNPYVVKSDATPAQATAIQAEINAFETALFASNFADPANGYAKYLDVDSMVDFYLVNELMRNNDAFFSSTFVFKPRGGKLTFGPLWDFDITAGNINLSGNEAPTGFWLNNSSSYVKRLLEDPAFKTKVAARWKVLSARLPELQTFIDTSAKTLDAAQKKNFERWDILTVLVWPNFQINYTYAGEITYLKTWLATRATWLDGQYAAWATTP